MLSSCILIPIVAYPHLHPYLLLLNPDKIEYNLRPMEERQKEVGLMSFHANINFMLGIKKKIRSRSRRE